MRIFPRFTRPSFKLPLQRLLRLRRYLSARRVVMLVEWISCGAVLLFALTNERAALADGFGQRAELAALALALAVCALLHAVLQRTLLPRLERYFSPVRYNERRILFDLGQEARQATDTDHLFRLIVGQIGAALQSEDASILCATKPRAITCAGFLRRRRRRDSPQAMLRMAQRCRQRC